MTTHRSGEERSHGHQVAQLGELGLADAGDIEQVVDRPERAVLVAVLDDRRRDGRSDAR